MTAPPRRPPAAPRPAIDPRIRQRRQAVRRRVGRRRLRVVIAVAVVIIVLGGGFALLHTSLFAARVVTVTGAHPQTPTAAIIQAAGLSNRPLLLNVDAAAAEARLTALPFIRTAQVTRHWPDGVQVTVTQRVPVAVMAGPTGSWAQLDASGRILAVQPARPPGLVQLIVTTAAGPVSPGRAGRVLPALAGSGLQVCRTLPLAFSAQVVSVSVAPNATIDLALNSGLTVVMGTTADLTVKYQDVASIIAHAALQGMKTIDVTVPGAPTVS
ncbi:MAG TPA: FtsQ-type POTRA domain-containing protein [Acidimicrobiales bacterium]|nr:FtsQ-type POTRA domain-containing protein [Acidimicrobiales bacterium]